MAKEKTIQLKETITFGKDQVTEVIIKQKLKYLRGHSLRVSSDGQGNGAMDLDFSTLIDLGAKMIGQPAAFLDEMGDEDQALIIQEARDFLLKHLSAGPQA